jgi:hypothetical protein
MTDQVTDLYEAKMHALVRTAFTDQALMENHGGIGDNSTANLSPTTLNVTDEIGRLVADELRKRGATHELAKMLREAITHAMPQLLAEHSEMLADMVNPEMMQETEKGSADLPDFTVK